MTLTPRRHPSNRAVALALAIGCGLGLDVRSGRADESALDRIERVSATLLFEQRDERSELVYNTTEPGAPASPTACGVALSGIPVGIERGWIRREEGYRRARRMLETCLREEPLLIEAQLLNASFAEEAGELQVAEQACRRALYIDRNCPMAHFHLALVQQQNGDLPGAKRSLQTTLKLVEGKEPHDLVAYGEGVCYGRLREMISLLVSDS